MHSLWPVICLYFCLSISIAEEHTATSKGENYESNKPPKRRTWKSKEDIPPEYLDNLKSIFGITDPPETDYPYEYDEDTNYYYDAVHDTTTVATEAPPATEVVEETVEENNATVPSQNETTCKSCVLREEDKQMRINSIKNLILNKIGFSHDNLPNMTRNIPRPPSIEKLLEQYQMQGDAPYQPTDEYLPEDDYYGQIQKAYTISQPIPSEFGIDKPGGVYFDIPDSVASRRIQNATLWLYLKRPLHNADKVIGIYLYVNPTAGKIHKVMQAPRRYKKAKFYGWHEFEIGHIVHHWLRHPDTNKGLILEAVDRQGRNLIAFPGDPDDENYIPMLEMSTVEHTYHRQKRSIPMVCSEDQKIDECCRYPLRVDFVEFGWDWVIAPTGYRANYCSGECRHQHRDTNPQSYIFQQTAAGNRADGGPCCTPSKMYPLAMLYFDHAHTVLYTYMQKMIVMRCGCA